MSLNSLFQKPQIQGAAQALIIPHKVSIHFA